MVLCGVPGAGKSTLAHHLAERWGAAGFASEHFADQLGAAARTPSGDLSKQAIAHAYAAMGAAATQALANRRLVVTVGSFRAASQRRTYRELASSTGASAVIVRVLCPVETAAERVRLRRAQGERGPGAEAIRAIDDELSAADDIDAALSNDTTIDHLCRRADAVMEALMEPTAGSTLIERFGDLAAEEFARTREVIDARRGNDAAVALAVRESRNRLLELRRCLLLGAGRAVPLAEAALGGTAEKWIVEIEKLRPASASADIEGAH
jgi:predicted kinase